MNDATKGWLAAPGKLLSIVSRAPAHAPWASANQGVDVKVNNNASSALPAAPSPAVAAANASAGAPTSPVTVAVASTVPPSSAISKALDKATTGTMVGQLSTLAATGPAAAAVKAGSGIVQTATGKVASVGQLAQSPEQMEQAGILKPGSAALIAKLIAEGKTIEQAMTPNLFTGMPGAENLQAYINNTTAQVEAQVVTLQKAQTALTNNGLITGKESGTQIAGLVMSAATAGVQNTVNLVSNAASAVTGAVNGAVANVVGAATGALNSVLGSASSLVSAGNFAGNLASTVTGGLGSIATSLTGMAKGAVAGLSGLLDSAKGVAGSAFAAISGALPTLKVGIPQNIKEITETAQAAAQAPTSKSLTGSLGAVTGALTTAVGSVTGALGTVTGAIAGVTGVTGALNAVTGAVAGVTGIIKNTVGVATGLGSLPGGGGIASVVNNAVGTVTSIPGVSAVSGLINTASSITTGITGLATNPLSSSGVLNAATGALGSLTKGLDDLKSGKISLATLASAGLPAGAAATFAAAFGQLTNNGPGGIKISVPQVAVGTEGTRPALDASVTELLDNPKIPAPNFAGNPATIGETAGSTAIKNKLKAQSELNEKVQAKNTEVRNARLAYSKAKNDLPEGDPQISELRDKWLALSDELASLNTVA